MQYQEKTNLNLRHLKEGEDQYDVEEEDAISLCDLPTYSHYHNQESESVQDHSITDTSFDFDFTFNTTPINTKNLNGFFSSSTANTTLNSCGRIKLINPFDDLYNNSDKNKAGSPHLPLPLRSKSCREPATSWSYRYGYSSSSSRKHKVLIGLAKIPTEMELSDIKKRQSKRRNPAPMFPVVAAGGGGDRKPAAADSGRKHHCVPIRSLRCGAHLASVLAKASLGCVRLS